MDYYINDYDTDENNQSWGILVILFVLMLIMG